MFLWYAQAHYFRIFSECDANFNNTNILFFWFFKLELYKPNKSKVVFINLDSGQSSSPSTHEDSSSSSFSSLSSFSFPILLTNYS